MATTRFCLTDMCPQPGGVREPERASTAVEPSRNSHPRANLYPFAPPALVSVFLGLLLQADFELKEITHCRLAMLAFSGMVTQAVLYNGGFPYTG